MRLMRSVLLILSACSLMITVWAQEGPTRSHHAVAAAAISPDASLYALVSMDGIVNIRKLSDDTLVTAYTLKTGYPFGGSGEIPAVSFMDADHLIADLRDGSLYVLGARTRSASIFHPSGTDFGADIEPACQQLVISREGDYTNKDGRWYSPVAYWIYHFTNGVFKQPKSYLDHRPECTEAAVPPSPEGTLQVEITPAQPEVPPRATLNKNGQRVRLLPSISQQHAGLVKARSCLRGFNQWNFRKFQFTCKVQ